LNLILLGGPGSGKGTQSKKIIELLGICKISTGDMLREIVVKRGELGFEIKQYLDQGRLVPNNIVFEMIKERLNEINCSKGFLFDGFPRNLEQGKILDTMLDDSDKIINHSIFFKISEEEMLHRITGRFICADCGEIFNQELFHSTKDRICLCGSKNIVKRDDDNEKILQNRIDEFRFQTMPLISYYENKGILRRIQCSGLTPDEVFFKVREVLGN
jgi:adenylate kinase